MTKIDIFSGFLGAGKTTLIKKMIEEAGHKFASSVSKKTSYLLASPGEESTSKYKNATMNNIPIIKSIEQLKEII